MSVCSFLAETSLVLPSQVVTLTALPSLFLGDSVLASVLLPLASIIALKFEALKKGKTQKQGVKGKIMNLSVETKVAIAVATSFVLLMVGAMAQG